MPLLGTLVRCSAIVSMFRGRSVCTSDLWLHLQWVRRGNEVCKLWHITPALQSLGWRWPGPWPQPSPGPAAASQPGHRVWTLATASAALLSCARVTSMQVVIIHFKLQFRVSNARRNFIETTYVYFFYYLIIFLLQDELQSIFNTFHRMKKYNSLHFTFVKYYFCLRFVV